MLEKKRNNMNWNQNNKSRNSTVEKTRKYDLLANEFSQLYNCKSNKIHYGILTAYHQKAYHETGLKSNIEAQFQSKISKKISKV